MPKQMQPGETVRMDCDSCSTEFEITYEPKAKGKAAAGIDPADLQIRTCPFCGDELPDAEDD